MWVTIGFHSLYWKQVSNPPSFQFKGIGKYVDCIKAQLHINVHVYLSDICM